jgi:hypothetical protein
MDQATQIAFAMATIFLLGIGMSFKRLLPPAKQEVPVEIFH